MRPNADSTCQRRARKPSIWSVIAAAPNRIAAGQLVPPSELEDQRREDRDHEQPRDREHVRQLRERRGTVGAAMLKHRAPPARGPVPRSVRGRRRARCEHLRNSSAQYAVRSRYARSAAAPVRPHAPV